MQVSEGHRRTPSLEPGVKKREMGTEGPGPLDRSGTLPSGTREPRQERHPASLDLCAATGVLLKPEDGITPVPVILTDTVPPGAVGLVIGRAALSSQGFIVTPGILHPEASSFSVLCSVARGVFAVAPGDPIAQLIFLPALISADKTVQTQVEVPYINLMMDMIDRPMLELQIENRPFMGLLDTGADKSIITSKYWPRDWPLIQTSHSLRGLGFEQAPSQSARALQWKDKEGNCGTVTPYVLNLPVCLWGRDILQQMGIRLVSNASGYSEVSQKLMDKMGYIQGKGLGKQSQGIVQPIEPRGNPGRKGLGF